MIRFTLLAIYFGLALYAATSSVVVLAAEAERSWLWWSTLLPLAVSHLAAGLLATSKDVRPESRHLIVLSGAISGATTVLGVGVAAWAAHHLNLGPWMPRHVAVLILIGASLAGLLGLMLAASLRLGSSWNSGPLHRWHRESSVDGIHVEYPVPTKKNASRTTRGSSSGSRLSKRRCGAMKGPGWVMALHLNDCGGNSCGDQHTQQGGKKPGPRGGHVNGG